MHAHRERGLQGEHPAKHAFSPSKLHQSCGKDGILASCPCMLAVAVLCIAGKASAGGLLLQRLET